MTSMFNKWRQFLKAGTALLLIFIMLLSAMALPADVVNDAGKDTTASDETKETYKLINDCPAKYSGKIEITLKATTAGDIKLTESNGVITIRDKAEKDKKVKIKFHENILKQLPGYNGEEFSYTHKDNNGVIDAIGIVRTADVKDKDGYIILETPLSEVQIGGATGYTLITKSDIDFLNTTTPVHIEGGTAFYVLINDPATYTVFNETNINTWPGTPSKWVYAHSFKGNAADITGNGHTVTVSGTGGYTTDRNGVANSALVFDGTDDFIYDVPDEGGITYTNLDFVACYYLTHDLQQIMTDFRNASGIGRTATYTTETAWYVNGGTTANKALNTSKNTWSVGIYPMTGALLNVWRLGTRYSGTFDLNMIIDYTGAYNGTLSADERRVFTRGYDGIVITTDPSSGTTPVLSANQSISIGTSLNSVTISSNVARTDTVSFLGLFTQNYTVVNEYDNGTNDHRVDMLFTPLSNVTDASLTYEMASVDDMGSPALTSDAPSASIDIVGLNLFITTGALTEDTEYYFNISFPYNTANITSYYPIDTTPEAIRGATVEFNVSTDAETDIVWKVDGGTVETDSATAYGEYNYTASTAGEFEISAEVFGDNQNWTLTVEPNQIISFVPTDLTPTATNDTAVTFTVNLDGPDTVTWYLDGVQQQQNDTVTTAGYVYNTNGTGDYNITALITADSKTWLLSVIIAGITYVKDTYVTASFVIATVIISSFAYIRNRTGRR